MKRELDPVQVTERLAVLRSVYVPESIDEARDRLERERPAVKTSLAERVSANLAELRAIYELAQHLAARPL